ncbi:hypothetical protein MFRU_011g02030 [Monilinia fructicola]|nr:hypothetical protein MFRU_011g02030 [Monilinia fructicola]
MVYMADDYSKTQMIGLGLGFLVLPIVAVALRLWAKYIGRRSFQADDYIILVALVFAIACCSIQLAASYRGNLGQHEADDANGQPILDDPRFVVYEKCKFAINMLTTIGLGLIKSSILVFYMNIFVGAAFVLTARVMLVIVSAWTISFFFANLFTCYPITPFVEPFYGHKCINSVAMWYAMSISDMIVDILILLLPIPMVLQLKLRPKQKMGVLVMFFLGATVCAFSVTRMLAYFHVDSIFLLHYNDETFYTSPVFFWANIELSSAILSACLPTYRPIWLHLTKKSQSNSGSVELSSYNRNKNSKYIYGSAKSGRRGESSMETESQADLNNLDDLQHYHSPAVNTRINAGGPLHSHIAPPKGIAVERSVDMS